MAILIALLISFFPPLADNLDKVPGAATALPTCQYEDGNIDAKPCIWKGKYYVTSENYR